MKIKKSLISFMAFIFVSVQGIAQKGSSDAMADPARRYENGKGVPASLDIARKWYSLAAEAGDLDSIRNLSSMLAEGRGGPVDNQKGYFWAFIAYTYSSAWNNDEGPLIEKEKLQSRLTQPQRKVIEQEAAKWMANKWPNQGVN